MNAKKYFTLKYWTAKFFATRPAGAAAQEYVASGGCYLAGAAITEFRAGLHVVTGSGGVYITGTADTGFTEGYAAVPVVLRDSGSEAVGLPGPRTDAVVLVWKEYAPAHAFYAGPVTLRCAQPTLPLPGPRTDAVVLRSEKDVELISIKSFGITLDGGG